LPDQITLDKITSVAMKVNHDPKVDRGEMYVGKSNCLFFFCSHTSVNTENFCGFRRGGDFSPPSSKHSRPQLYVLQVNSTLMLSTWGEW
jgi:hypothetical protein